MHTYGYYSYRFTVTALTQLFSSFKCKPQHEWMNGDTTSIIIPVTEPHPVSLTISKIASLRSVGTNRNCLPRVQRKIWAWLTV